MLMDLHARLQAAGISVSLGEWLTLIGGLHRSVGTLDIERFYRFARLCLIKDESLYDRFDQVFSDYWTGQENRFDAMAEALQANIPEDWLIAAERDALTDAQKAAVEALGGWDELMKTLAERLAEQQEAHHGGNRWIGTGGTSAFGHSGYNPAGVRIGTPPPDKRQGRGVKVWQQRQYRDLDGDRELGTRNFRLALRKLRRLAREGRPDTLDLDTTIQSTARNAGLLDIHLQAERRNTMKVLLLIDIGGSMDYHAALSETLFAAARSEFQRLDVYWFHNFPYENLWQDNARRHTDHTPTLDVIRRYKRDTRLVLVGDATMSPYEIVAAGGSVEHWNEEPGAVWLQRLQQAFPHAVWLNPEKPDFWDTTPSIRMTRELMQERMYPLTVTGLQSAIDALKTPLAVSPRPAPA